MWSSPIPSSKAAEEWEEMPVSSDSSALDTQLIQSPSEISVHCLQNPSHFTTINKISRKTSHSAPRAMKQDALHTSCTQYKARWTLLGSERTRARQRAITRLNSDEIIKTSRLVLTPLLLIIGFGKFLPKGRSWWDSLYCERRPWENSNMASWDFFACEHIQSTRMPFISFSSPFTCTTVSTFQLQKQCLVWY